MPGPPTTPPLGLQLARTARAVTQAFDRAMADAGGSAAVWQVLVLIRSRQWGQQSKMAEAIGISGATLTHHLNALERQGLVRRWRDEGNRRVQRTELTDEGIALFDRLRTIAAAHDTRLRSQLTDHEATTLGELLEKLRAGVAEPATRSASPAPPSTARAGRA
jgi:MarR family transcriptional regulator, transcriptional regulator for hemolysin